MSKQKLVAASTNVPLNSENPCLVVSEVKEFDASHVFDVGIIEVGDAVEAKVELLQVVAVPETRH